MTNNNSKLNHRHAGAALIAGLCLLGMALPGDSAGVLWKSLLALVPLALILKGLKTSRHLLQAQQEVQAQQSEIQDLRQHCGDLEKFAYVASHDLQAPIRTIIGFMELLREDHPQIFEGEVAESFDMIESGAIRMRSLVGDLLSYTRVDCPRNPAEPRDVCLNDVLDGVLDDLKDHIARTDARIERQDLPTVLGNPQHLKQAFTHLVRNALEYRSEATPEVLIKTWVSGDDAHISIQDNGIGIDPKYHQQIFEVFQRLHGRSDHPGNGIGLALVRRVVETMGGQVSVESTEGHGANFTLQIPALVPA